MHCPQCQAENSATSRFCRACGNKLAAPTAASCPHCRGEVAVDARFCRHCGQAIAASAPSIQPPVLPPLPPALPLPALSPIRPPTEKAKLVCIVGALQGMIFRVGPGVTLGRAPDADIVLQETEISKRHAWVGVSHERLFVRDLKSTNGTYLNDQLDAPVTETELHEGDVLQLGKHNDTKFRVTFL